MFKIGGAFDGDPRLFSNAPLSGIDPIGMGLFTPLKSLFIFVMLNDKAEPIELE